MHVHVRVRVCSMHKHKHKHTHKHMHMHMHMHTHMLRATCCMRTCRSFSSGSSEHVAYTRVPPGRASVAARRSTSACTGSNSSSGRVRRSQRASGLRRQAPTPEHGASTSTRSKERLRRLSHWSLPTSIVWRCTLSTPAWAQ